MIQEDAFKSGTQAGGLTEREKGGVTLTLKVLAHTTEAPKSEKIRLIHEFSQTRRRNINFKKRLQSGNLHFSLKPQLKNFAKNVIQPECSAWTRRRSCFQMFSLLSCLCSAASL